MKTYLDALNRIMNEGIDRDGHGGLTRALFGLQLRFDLRKGFPAVTTKRLAFEMVIAELLWFIEGSGDSNRLKELLGRDQTVWTRNAEMPYWKKRAKFHGDLGRVYGIQWRHWRKPVLIPFRYVGHEQIPEHWEIDEIDQLAQLIGSLKDDPFGRRHIVTAWNPGELDEMALPPCHMFFQFFAYPDGRLSLHMVQRSCDMFLGVPFNIASYALLLSMISQVVNMKPYECILTLNDAHIYHNHFYAVIKQVSREPLPLPKLWLNPKIDQIGEFGLNDIRLTDYQHHPPVEGLIIL